MPRTAITGYVVFLALAFGLRAILHYRRTGSSGFVGLSGRPGSIEWLAGVLFGVAVITGGLAPLAQLLGLLQPVVSGDAPAMHVAGVLCFGIGLAGTLQAQASMGDSWRIGVDSGERTDLVSRGPFRWVRNPIFTWMSLATVGLVLLTPNVLAIASLVILLVVLEVQVRAVEEPYLLRTHGASYRKYASTTGRFVPGIGRFSDE
jgi:protein-S-isoprenylcysteine O-methyltransferase Ste14